MSSIRSITGALPFIARALGDSLGVVVKQGPRACTDGQVIYSPPLSEDDQVYKGKHFSAYDLAKRLGIGRIVHESGHVRYTDFSACKELHANPLSKGVLNILEDIRIEAKIMRDFPGTKHDLQQMTEVLAVDGFWSVMPEDAHPSVIMQSWMLYKLRHDVLGQTGLADVLAETDSIFKKVIPEGVQIKLEALMFEVKKAKSTQDAGDLTKRILTMMEEEAKKEEEEEQKREQQQSQQASQSSDGNGDSSDGQQPDSSQGVDGQGNSVQQGKDDGSEQSAGNSGGQQDQASDDGEQSQSHNAGDGARDDSASETIKKILSASSEHTMKDLGDELAEFLDSVSDSSVENIVANTVHSKALGSDDKFYAETTGAVNALSHKMHILLQAQTRSRVLSAPVGSKIRSSKLHTAKLGGNVFARKVKATKIDTAVSILIDRSASMRNDGKGGVPVDTARRAGFAIAKALEMVNGVKVSVSTFPSSEGSWLAVETLNRFGEPLRSRVANFSKVEALGNTPLSECLSAVACEIAARRENRKIIMVVTDGEPNNADAALKVIQRVEHSGIEICGLGINFDVSHLFSRNSSITDINELSTAMFGMLQDVMLKAA